MSRSKRSAGWSAFVVATLVFASACGDDAESSEVPASSKVPAASSSSAATPSSAAPDTSAVTEPDSEPATEAPTDDGAPSTWPLRQKLAQMLFTGTNAPEDSATDPTKIQELIDAGAGGVFAGRKETQVFASPVFVNAADRPVAPFVATDAEGGQVDLLASILEPLPAAREMAAWEADRIREAGRSRGAGLAELGVTVDFAPVVDVAGGSNPLGDRTWSDDPAEVVATAGVFAEGLCEAGVLPTFKHFPGHGRADAHGDDAPAETPELSSLEGNDIVAFTGMFEQMGDRSMLMTGHLDVPGLTDGGEPFSMNPEAMAWLRNDLGYQGVTVTDELAEMGAITARDISVPDAVEASLVAGNDLALYFGDVDQMNQVLDQLEAAVADGRLSESQVDRSVERIMVLKTSGASVGC
ncbi:MAG: glycoside hydrolase family 3 protein [Candidatus Microthrix sp.]|jgi:beta-N-acetylhexosaminidase|uniref:beta-N-acetylhexosaminidase n=1 Tax=Candidatus Neomicrothrix subdominans TaxID=2954438 RepID=A0A936NAI0_9ACTN|nr:glycoside hydrolase family 3 protein [Candidatus Microthrix subdominans]